MPTRNLKVSLLPLLLVGALLYLTANLLVWGREQKGASAGLVAEGPISPNVPPLPFSPYGTVKGNGENAPPDALVSAWCLDVQYAITGTIDFQGETWYAIDIPGDDPEGAGKDGCYSDDPVEFKVDGYLATPLATPPLTTTLTWESGQSYRLDLAYGFPTPTPTLTASPTPTASPIPTASPTPTETPVPTDDGWLIYLPLIQSK